MLCMRVCMWLCASARDRERYNNKINIINSLKMWLFFSDKSGIDFSTINDIKTTTKFNFN